MKTLLEYIKENNNQIKTQDVVNILKNSGETPQEIKQDVDIKQKHISYKDLVEAFTKKCHEWIKAFGNLLQIADKEEGKGFIVQRFGRDWAIEFSNRYKEFAKSINELEKQLNVDVNESVSVKNIKNYQNLYNLFTGLQRLDDLMVNVENGLAKDNEFKNLVDARKNVSDKMQALIEMSGKIKKLIDITLDLMNMKI